tara:strand:- start:2072 stop:2308 length:237 start_codon:yes stop_codon:yes gene_type:complete
MLKTKKMSKKQKMDFEGMLCDKYRFEIPVDYDEMQNKKLRIYNYQTNESYLFTFSSRHGQRMNVDTFFALLKREGIIQ